MKRVISVILLIGLLLMATIVLSGCDSVEKEEYRRQGTENAINYVKKKYGIEAHAIDVINLFDWSVIPVPTLKKDVLVKLKEENTDKIFFVNISGAEKSDYGMDNYQFEEISNDIISTIKKDFPNIYGYEISYGKITNYGENIEGVNGIIEFKYDKTNISKVLDRAYITINCVNENNIQNIDFNNKFQEWKEYTYEISFRNFKSEQDLEDFNKAIDYPLLHINDVVRYYKRADKTEINWENYKDNLYIVNDDMYVYAKKYNYQSENLNENNFVEGLVGLSIEKSKMDWNEYKNISDTFCVKKSNPNDKIDKIIVSIPKNKYKQYFEKDSLALICKNEKEINIRDYLNDENNYYSFELNDYYTFGEYDSFYFSLINYKEKY